MFKEVTCNSLLVFIFISLGIYQSFERAIRNDFAPSVQHSGSMYKCCAVYQILRLQK